MTDAGRQAFEKAYSYKIVPKGTLMEKRIMKHNKELRPGLYKESPTILKRFQDDERKQHIPYSIRL